MANTLDGLFQTIYSAMNVVSRERIGMIPYVSKDASAEMAAVDQPIRSPIVPDMAAADITPANIAPTGPDQTITHVDLTITKQRKVSFHLTAEEEKGLMVGGVHTSVAQQRFEQAFRTLGNEIENDLCGEYVNASQGYGTPGTTPFNTADDLTDATEVMKLLDDYGAPRSGRVLVLNTASTAKLLGKQPALFRVNEAGQEVTRRFGMLEQMYGFNFGVSGQFTMHTNAPTGYLLKGGEPGGSDDKSIAVDTGTAAIGAGDTFTIAGVDGRYLVQTGATGDASITIHGRDGLAGAGADNAALTFATYTPNLAFSMDALHLACRVPAVNSGGDQAVDRMYVTDPVSGLTYEIAVFSQYRQVSYEVAICWGVKTIKSDHMAILFG